MAMLVQPKSALLKWKEHIIMGNLVFFTASSACLLCVKADGNGSSILAGEIPTFRTVGSERSGERLFLICQPGLCYSGSLISAGDRTLCLGHNPVLQSDAGLLGSPLAATVWSWDSLASYAKQSTAVVDTEMYICNPFSFQILPKWYILTWSYLCVTVLPDSPGVQPWASWTWTACPGTWYHVMLVIVPTPARRAPQSSCAALENHLQCRRHCCLCCWEWP